jgi:glutamate synthase domain-containing protein 1
VRGGDSAIFDDVLGLLALTGRSLRRAIARMIPEAWQENASAMDPARRPSCERRAFVTATRWTINDGGQA